MGKVWLGGGPARKRAGFVPGQSAGAPLSFAGGKKGGGAAGGGGGAEEEVADLRKVVGEYPQSRDARRELGVSYYRQHRYEEARQQFEALQEIDPDDVSAHYNLTILYRRLGLQEKSAEQAALFATKKVDPAAPTFSLGFLRKHPTISGESVPWHVHSDLPQASTAVGGQP